MFKGGNKLTVKGMWIKNRNTNQENSGMRRTFIILLCLGLSSMTLFAQDDANFNLFPWASLYYNPGTAGEQMNTFCFTAIYKEGNMGLYDNQFPEGGTDSYGEPIVGYDLGSRDFLINAEFYSRKIRGAIGLSFISDNFVNENNIGIRLGYTYRMKLFGGSLGIGFQVGLLNRNTDAERYWAFDDGDPVILTLQNADSDMNLDFNFGIAYKSPKWDIGASIVQMLGDDATIILSGENEMKSYRQLHLHGGYNFTLPNAPSWTIEPKAMLRTNLKTITFDVALLTRWNGIVWGGLGYRLDESVNLLFGATPFYNSSNIYMKGLEMGFCYSFKTTKYANTSRGSWGDLEIMVRYCFDLYKQETSSGYGSSRNIYKNEY